MEHKEFISSMNWENLKYILNTESLNEDTISKLKSINTTGYDLCIEPKKFLSSIGINNQHEQNSILKSISPYINLQLNISFYYNGKYYKIQLENDINYTIEMLISSIKSIFSINEDLFLCPYSNGQNITSVLLPNFKIVKKIFEEPEKYTSLMKFSPNDNNYIPIRKEINDQKIIYEMNEEIINNNPKNTIQCKEIFIKNDFNSDDINNSIKKNYYQNQGIKNPNNNIIDNYFQAQKTIKLENESFNHIKRNTKRKDDGINFSKFNYDDTLNKTEQIFNRFKNDNINNINQNNINENNISLNNINENNISLNNFNENNINDNNINKSEINNPFKTAKLKDTFLIYSKNMKDEDTLNKTSYSVLENDKSIDINNNSILLNKENKKLINNKSLTDINPNIESYKYSKKLSYQNSLNSSNTQIKQFEIQREKDREELNTYIKKGYGIYPLEGTKLFSISTDRRNYRVVKSNSPDNIIEKNKSNIKGESNLKNEMNKKVNAITIKLNHTPERKIRENEIILNTNSNNNYVYKSKYLNEMISKNSDKDINEIKINEIKK